MARDIQGAWAAIRMHRRHVYNIATSEGGTGGEEVDLPRLLHVSMLRCEELAKHCARLEAEVKELAEQKAETLERIYELEQTIRSGGSIC